MAESSTPAEPKKAPAKKATTTRKKTTKRGPTKAAALKALGLTQEDLNTLKAVAEARERMATEVQEKTEAQQVGPTQEEIDTHYRAIADARKKIEAYKTLSQAIPEDVAKLAAELLPANDAIRLGLAEDKSNQSIPVTPDSRDYTPPKDQVWYIRNLTGYDTGFRLERQQGPGKQRTNLKPRGMRGDLVKLQPGDEKDGALRLQIAQGIVELVPEVEAIKIIEKQVINAQQQIHPAMATIRNEYGERYQQTEVPVVDDGSYTVAYLQPQGGEAGAIPDQGRGVDWQAARAGQPQTQQSAPGGNPAIVSSGFPNRPDQAAVADAVARTKGLQGPAAGLGGLAVTVAPTQRT